MTENVRNLLESLYLEDTIRITYPNLIQINDFFCYYDKSLSIEFKNFLIRQNNKDFVLKWRKLLIIFRLLKKFMKKAEIQEIKQIISSISDSEFDKSFISSINPNIKKKITINTICSYINEEGLEKFQKIITKFNFVSIKIFFITYINYLNYNECITLQASILKNINFLNQYKLLSDAERDEIRAEIYTQSKNSSSKQKNLKELLDTEKVAKKDEEKIQNIIKIITDHLLMNRKEMKFSGDLNIICFGSFINGFSLKRSDIDCSILTNNYVDERQFLYNLNTALEPLQAFGFQFLLLNSKQIRVPILKISCHELGEMDIAINNVLGVANSKLLDVYSKITSKCVDLGKLVKIWGKNHLLIGPTAMSSYGMILLVIYFLQLKKIVPSLQSIAKEKRLLNGTKPPIMKIKRKVKTEVEEFDTIIEFETDQSEIQKYMERNKFPINFQTLDELLLEFFHFYKKDGLFLSNGMRCNIKKGKVDFVRRKNEELCLYSIVDPFDLLHNPGMRVRVDKFGENDRMLNAINLTINYLENDDFRSAFKMN